MRTNAGDGEYADRNFRYRYAGQVKNKSTHPEEMGGGDVSRHIVGQLLT